MSKLAILPALLLLALPGLNAQEAARPVQLSWGELAPIIGNHKVKLALPDGAVISGEAITVREDALVLDVKQTSNTTTYPKGYTPVPRDSVSLLQVERRSRNGTRAITTTVGVISGVIGGGYIAAKIADQTAGGFLGAWAGVASASSVGAYLIGKKIDTHTTYIKVVE